MSLVSDDVDEPPYLEEFLLGKTNVIATLGAAAVAVALSFPFGLAGFAFVGVGWLALEALGALYVPSLSTFRNDVQRKYGEQRRQGQVTSLLEQLRARGECDPPSARMAVYNRMLDRVQALEHMVTVGACSLRRDDIDRLKDACRDYLARWLAIASSTERQVQIPQKDIAAKLREVETLLQADRPDIDRRQLTQARDEYTRLLDRRTRLNSRMIAIEASLASMPDTIEDVFQHAVSMPNASDASDRLRESVDRLGVEEDLEADIRDELGQLGSKVAVAPARRPDIQMNSTGTRP